MAKTLLIGDCGVGKTKILNKLLNIDNVNAYKSTIGVDLKWKDYSFLDK